MARTIFITGGTRSGKSVFAEKVALEYGTPLGYLATAQPLDNEMDQRIHLHRQRRGNAWQTIEEPLLLEETLRRLDGRFNAILVDCVTLWLTNMLLRHETMGQGIESRILNEVERLATALPTLATPLILVSNEVGMGIVPEHRLGRLFRDIAGQANQILAATADEAWLVASGIPLRLK